MTNKIIIANDSIALYLDELEKMGYDYIIKASDKFLSGWGYSENKKHIQLIACRKEQKDTILIDLSNDKTLNYINWYYIKDRKSIYQVIKNKSYTIRNDWTRCFKNKDGGEL